MKVSVKLFATLATSASKALRAQYPQGIRAGRPFEVELPEGCSLADLVTYLSLPREQVRIVFVNARVRRLDYRLQSGDEVGIFPPIGGG